MWWFIYYLGLDLYPKKVILIAPTVIEKFNDQWSENMIFV